MLPYVCILYPRLQCKICEQPLNDTYTRTIDQPVQLIDREELIHPVHHPQSDPDSPLQARRFASRPIVDEESELDNWAKNVSILAATPDRVRNDFNEKCFR